MTDSGFSFKKFTVRQALCAMKVGTDGVLLGAWAGCEETKQILDVGTGTGLIALMLAQRSTALVDAIDVNEQAFIQAQENFQMSSFAERLQAYHIPFQEYKPTKSYDLIVSNPPYFSKSLRSPDAGRTTARHDDSLPLSELVSQAVRLLSPEGRLALVLPFDLLDSIVQITQEQGLCLVRRTDVYPTPHSPAKRLLLEFSRENLPLEHTHLTIELGRHHYTPEYIALTREFYLKI
ncbi:methyltransferase [Bacteroidales bacterium OttesenSCG-928-J19]|nr:methyltransferase [Bacteroidales bacterium OttesenSCG-928-J19]